MARKLDTLGTMIHPPRSTEEGGREIIASKVTREALEHAAHEVGVVAEIEGQGGGTHGAPRRFRVKLFPLVEDAQRTPAGHRRKGDRGDTKYQRESVGYGSAGRRVNAVCWHGFRDYFRAVFAQESTAVFRTALDTWRGSEDFEKRFPESGSKQIGPPIAPVLIVDACRCQDRGIAS